MDEFSDPARRDDNARQSPRIWHSEDLLGEENEVLILYGDQDGDDRNHHQQFN